MRTIPARIGSWKGLESFSPKQYTCGHCGAAVGADKGYQSVFPELYVSICPMCALPTIFDNDKQIPGTKAGKELKHLPATVSTVYEEARNCFTVCAYSGAVLLCRKLLMHFAVEKGAKAGETFASYVSFLEASGYAPPNSKVWLDEIRLKGNEATHEIVVSSEADAKKLLAFLEMLFVFAYEYPAMS